MLKHNLRWVLVVLLMLVSSIAYADRVNFSMATPFIATEFGLNSVQVGVIMSGFTLGYTIASFPGGLLSQYFSSHVVITIALIGWSAMTFLTGIAWSFASLLLVRIIFGIFEAPYFPNAYKIIGEWVLPTERGTTAGLGIVGVPVGIVLGNILSAQIIESFGWRSVFFIFGVVGFVMCVVLWGMLRDEPKEHPLITKEELELIELSKDRSRDEVISNSKGLAITQIVKNPVVWALTVAVFLYNLGFWANVNWLPTYFIKVRGSNITQAGMNSAIPFIAMGLGIIIVGRLADKVRVYKGWVFTFSAFAMAPLMIYGIITPSVTACLAAFSAANFFFGGVLCMTPAYEMEMWQPRDVAIIHGLVLVGGSAAGIVAPILVGYVLDTTHSFNMAYYIFAIATFFSGLLGLYLSYHEKKVKIVPKLIAVKLSS